MTSDSAAGGPPLGGLFFPKAVALVGASDRSYLARQVWESIRGGGYEGPVYPINPNRETVYGTKCYSSLGDVPSKPDLCLIAVSETAVGGVLQDCAANGIGSVILYTVFSNTAEGESLRQSARASAAANRLVVAGPGTFGLLNHGARFIPLMSSPGNTRVGNVALVCQSGGIMNCVLGALGDLGVGLSKIVATGGEDCLGAVDYLDYFLDVDPPAAIGCALEQVKDLARFRATCERARSLGVPIVVLKTGRSEVGARAALAHSGSLAGDDALIDAALRQSGTIRVENLTELVSLLALQSKLHPRVLGNKAFVMTISGGETGLTADLAEKHGIQLPALPDAANAALGKVLNTPARFENPVDAAAFNLTVLNEPLTNVDATAVLLATGGADFVLARYLPQAGVFEGYLRLFDESDGRLVLYTRTSFDTLAMQQDNFLEAIPILPDAEHAFAVLGKLAGFYRDRETAAEDSPALPELPEGMKDHARVLTASATRVLTEERVFSVLAACGFATPPLKVLNRGDDALSAARALPPPYIVKISSDRILHRRRFGGVIADLRSAEEVPPVVARFFADFGDDARAVVVETMVAKDIEVFLGARRDLVSGLGIVFGLGGTFVEDVGATALRLSPLGVRDAEALVRESHVASAMERLAGDSAARLIQELKRLILAFDGLCQVLGGDLVEFDINPLGVDLESERVWALDSKIVLASDEGNKHEPT